MNNSGHASSSFRTSRMHRSKHCEDQAQLNVQRERSKIDVKIVIVSHPAYFFYTFHNISFIYVLVSLNEIAL